ncbi:MAG: hypothetical protein GXY36_13180 [Chloroflexi bacterium]|jgi:hypothetical protein|nr:hypothetical protein [Chloroflexota bacterium]
MSLNRVLRSLAFVVIIMAVAGGIIAQVQASGPEQDAPANLTLQVAEDGNRFIFDDGQLFPDGLPNYGSAFVTQGYVYPEGTLNGTNGVLPNGEPEFPDQVLGEWTCYGWMIGEGAHTTTGQWVISTQVYQFSDGSMLITDGFELVDFDVPLARAITGGTGTYRGATGEMVQTLHGFTEQMGVNLTVEFQFDE